MKKFLALSLMVIICLTTISSCGFFDKYKDMYYELKAQGEKAIPMLQEFTSEFLVGDYDGALTKLHPNSTIDKENLEKMRADFIQNHNLDEIDSSTAISFTKMDFELNPIGDDNGDIVQTQYTFAITMEVAGVSVSISSIVLFDDLGFGIYTYTIK